MEKNNITKILIRGINWSGSGTVVDLLREYENLIQIPGGASQIAPAGYTKYEELWDYNHSKGVKNTLKKEISQQDIDSLGNYVLIQQKKLLKAVFRNFKGATGLKWKYEALKELPLMWRLLGQTKSFHKKLLLSASQEERIEMGKEWIDSLISVTKGTDVVDGVIFDQTVDLGQTKEIWSKIFEPFKLIMVHRNPYDQLAEQVNKKYYLTGGRKEEVLKKYQGDPHGYVKYFCAALKENQSNLDAILEYFPKDKVLLLRFEDIVLDYEVTKAKIEKFLSIEPGNHTRPKRFLKPDWSKNNIGLYEKGNYNFPSELMAPLYQWYENH